MLKRLTAPIELVAIKSTVLPNFVFFELKWKKRKFFSFKYSWLIFLQNGNTEDQKKFGNNFWRKSERTPLEQPVTKLSHS